MESMEFSTSSETSTPMRSTQATGSRQGSMMKKRIYQTPPGGLIRVRNPFEHIVQEKLHTHFCSPSVFIVKTPKQEENICWTIDELSVIKPANIEDTHVEQMEHHEHDSALESITQSRIDTYFNLKEIVPSPFAVPVAQSPLVKEADATPPPKKNFQDNSAQTILSLPSELPAHVEEALRPYFNYNENQQAGGDTRNSLLYRQLFEFEDKNVSDTSSSPKSVNMSPIQFSSPFSGASSMLNVNSEGCLNTDELKDCNLSPICLSSQGKSARHNRSVTRLSFSSQQMSVNMSYRVPDGDVQSFDGTQLLDETKPLPQDSPLSDSSAQWDLEYKLICSPSSSNVSSVDMDVSNSNTPKYRKLGVLVKKLSDSFEKEDPSAEDAVPNEQDTFKLSADAGYQTGSMVTFDDDSCHMFASTPTKLRLLNKD